MPPLPHKPLILLTALLCGCGGRAAVLDDQGAVSQPQTDAVPGTSDAAVAGEDTLQPPAPADPACANIQCELLNDCCHCAGVTPAELPNYDCAAVKCKQPSCGAKGIYAPAPYCAGGRCLVTDRNHGCAADSDCQMVNDCCGCWALPRGADYYIDCPMDCDQGQCDAMGLAHAEPRCVAGVCKLVMP